MDKRSLKLSVVVIGRNEAATLVECLDSVSQIFFPKEEMEVIYVDSRSTDNSLELARSKEVKILEIADEKPSAALARNTGWKAAFGDFIFFLDADTLLDPHFITKALREFESPNIGIVSGDLRERKPFSSLFNLVFDVDWDISAREYCGGNALIRKAALEKVQGYNTELIAGEEPEMCLRMQQEGYFVKHLPIPMGVHDLDIKNFWQYWQRCFRSGYAYASIAFPSKKAPFALWKKESLHNLLKGALMIAGIFFSLLFVIFYHKFYPLIIYMSLLAFLALRTASKQAARHSWKTRLLYGIHAHFQHIPLFFGQISFWIKRMRRCQR